VSEIDASQGGYVMGLQMSKDEFETSLREHLNREPFSPFVVNTTDGRRIVIDVPQVVFCDGDASFIDAIEGALVEFSNDQVKSFEMQEAHT
jgi:hypothetical protein